ncbi:hypothetical protein CEP53_012811 [Fusarium sp. AF-6]|nr:hypothetical protein CEP53_012811 [Fusarium sp. AF-6]
MALNEFTACLNSIRLFRWNCVRLPAGRVLGQALAQHNFTHTFASTVNSSKNTRWLTSVLQLGGWLGALTRAAWIDEKIEIELATMRYVTAKTTIPVPYVWMLTGANLFHKEVRGLVAAVRDRERALQARPRLSQEWAKLEKWCHTAVVVALLSLDLIYDAYWDLVFYEAEEPKPEDPDFDFREFYMKTIHPRLIAFMEAPERKALLARKEEEQKRFFEDEKEYFKNPNVGSILLPEEG